MIGNAKISGPTGIVSAPMIWITHAHVRALQIKFQMMALIMIR